MSNGLLGKETQRMGPQDQSKKEKVSPCPEYQARSRGNGAGGEGKAGPKESQQNQDECGKELVHEGPVRPDLRPPPTLGRDPQPDPEGA